MTVSYLAQSRLKEYISGREVSERDRILLFNGVAFLDSALHGYEILQGNVRKYDCSATEDFDLGTPIK